MKINKGLTILAFILLIIYIFPFLMMLVNSIQPEKDIVASKIIPSEILISNYGKILEQGQIGRWFINSVVVSVSATLMVIVMSVFAAYSLGRMMFPGRKLLNIVVLTGITIPIQAIMIPLFLQMKDFGFINTYWGLILPAPFAPMCVFILANFFREIPNAYDEAARMDGASHLTIMWRIITPMSLPAVASIAILNFTWTWNYYLWPLIIATTDTMYTLPVGLATLAGSETNIRYGPIMAANIMASIPVIVLFIIFQKNLMQGVSAGSGVK